MEKNKMSNKISVRESIRNRLKGTLSSWKLDPNVLGDRKQSVSDRTPEPVITNTQFEDSFRLGRKIGQGASGAVYLCQSKETGVDYAVKISRGDEEILRISKRTYKVLKNLIHPFLIVPECLYLNEVRETVQFVMEYCPYSPLYDQINVLTQQDKKNVITKLLQALSYLHSQGVCHRDIKLENILYDRSTGDLKLIDFGISKRITTCASQIKQKMWTNTGTLQYMAPEILNGMDYEEIVDCWALGVLTYKLFFNRFPFESEYKSEIINQICNFDPLFSGKDAVLLNFIKHLLMKNPKQRMSAVQGLHHPWIETPVKKTRLGSDADIQIFQSRLRNNSCVEVQDEKQLPQRSGKKKKLNLNLKDIFHLRKARMQTKVTQSESSPEHK